MGNCVSALKRKKEPKKAITLAIIGLDNGGKTTLCSVFTGETPDPDIAPTVGFRSVKFSMANFDITLFDLGGGKNIRPIWKNYFGEIYGALYVLDSSSATRMKDSRDLFRESLEHPLVSGKPVLVVANKVDLEDHLEEVDIVNRLDLERTVNATNCPSHFVMVSALKGTGNKMDKELQSGLKWLLARIRDSLPDLDPRVEEDVHKLKEIRDKEKEERRERVRKQREERERLENLERERLGLGKKRDSDDDDIIAGDPFKPLDYNELKKKELDLKDEKRRRKEKFQELGDGDKFRIQRSKDDLAVGYGRNRSLDMHHSPRSFTRFGLDVDGLDDVDANMNHFGRNTRPSALPPLEPMVSQSLNSQLSSMDNKKKGKKKKKLTDYQTGNDDGIFERKSRDDAVGRLGLSLHEPGSWNRPEADVHDLTPRVSKPKKNSKMTRSGKIDEDDSEGRNDIYNTMSLKEYGNARMTEKLNKYGEMYPLKSYNRDSLQRNGDVDTRTRWKMEREDSLYRRSLKDIAPPNLKRFDDDDDEEDEKNIDEGIEDNSDNISEDDMYKYRSSRYGNKKNVHVSSYDRDARHKATKKRVDSDDDELEYSMHSTLKDTMRFPRSPPEGESAKDFRKELEDLRQRKANDYYSQRDKEQSHYDRYSDYSKKKNKYDDEDDADEYAGRYNNRKLMERVDDHYSRNLRSPVDDDDESLRYRSSGRTDQHRKKKKNIFKSNRLMPSDDDEMEVATPKSFGAPRLVQEHGSRNNSDADTPSKSRTSRSTYFHGSSRDSEFENKWGLAEDLPAIDNGYGRRLRRPNFDSDGEDVIY